MNDKKKEILEKASLIFLKYGIKSVTMDDLSRELVISKKTLYQFFKDKNELVNEIISGKISLIENLCINAINEAENSIDELFKISVHISTFMKNIHPSVFYDLKKFHPNAWEIITNHRMKFAKNSIKNNIKRGKLENLYRNEINEDIISNIYIVSTDLISGSDLLIESNLNTDQIFIEILSYNIHGLVNEKGLKYFKNKLNELK